MDQSQTAQPRIIQRYGWKPSLPDGRDLVADTSLMPILPEVDPRGQMTPIYNQLQLGSCTANAVARCIDYDRIVSGLHPIYPSRLALYACERIIEGSPLTGDTGAFGRDGFKAAQTLGLLPESMMPYSDQPAAWQVDPRSLLAAESPAIKLTKPYKKISRNVRSFKSVLSNSQFIAFGFTVHESFESQAVAQTGVVPIPAPTERVLGGHEVVMIGYLAAYPHHALCANSWGTGWGLGGCFLMPWEILLDVNSSADFRTIYRPA